MQSLISAEFGNTYMCSAKSSLLARTPGLSPGRIRTLTTPELELSPVEPSAAGLGQSPGRTAQAMLNLSENWANELGMLCPRQGGALPGQQKNLGCEAMGTRRLLRQRSHLVSMAP